MVDDVDGWEPRTLLLRLARRQRPCGPMVSERACETRCLVKGGLAVHRALPGDCLGGWVITHARSGGVVWRCRETRRNALAVAERLLLAGDWDRPAAEIVIDVSLGRAVGLAGAMADNPRAPREDWVVLGV